MVLVHQGTNAVRCHEPGVELGGAVAEARPPTAEAGGVKTINQELFGIDIGFAF